MKTVIVSLNAKYIHSSLAPWYLKACCGAKYGEVCVLEFTINDNMDHILMDIYEQKADVVAFSCYIWNISYVLKLIVNIRKICPGLKIILGGPEVSFECKKLMESNPFIDFIIAGEAELSFPKVLECLYYSLDNFSKIEGLFYRDSAGRVMIPEEVLGYVRDVNDIPSPYTEELLSSIGKSKIAYFESSRGCPFSCSYCLSSVSKGVRFFNIERVKSDLIKLINAGVKQVKFVDRTFNCNKKRALEIFSFVIENGGDTNFHFEAAADLFDDELLDLLRTAPVGQIQFEIGVQSTNKDTLEAVDRKTNLEKVFYNTSRLKEKENIHIHMDLIAGLPLEDMNSFIKSFNDVYKLGSHQLQLGFLKLLKGSKVRRDADLHGYLFRDYPPYEVLSNRYMSFDDISELKGVEEIVERYYNTGRFINTLKYIVDKLYSSLPYIFYRDFYRYNSSKGYLRRAVSLKKLYDIVLNFVKENFSYEDVYIVNELLKLDFLSRDKSGSLPEEISRTQPKGFKEFCFDFLRNEENIQTYLPQFAGESPKNIYKHVHFELFKLDVSHYLKDGNIENHEAVLLFDYSSAHKVNGRYNFHNIAKI